MVDENPSAAAGTPSPAKKAKRHKRTQRTTQTAQRTAAPAAASQTLLMAVYVVLGLLVIGTSFYTGYLAGKSNGGTTPGPTGNGGQLEGAVQIIEYSDFQCPFCSRAAPTVKQLQEAYGDKIQVTYKNFPLEGLHPDALNAAIAAECVRKQGGDEAFWTYHDTLFANQASLDIASLKRFAAAQGLNADEFNTCLDTKETEPTVRADMQEGQARGVQGTPSFWIKDELVVGALPYEMLKAKVDEKLSGVAAPAAPAAPSAPAPAQVQDVAAGSFVRGDAKAPVLLVEFTDFQCPFCKRHHDQTTDQIIKNYVDTGKVRWTVRSFPLPFHENAQKAAEAAECVGKLGGADKYWAYYDTLFDNQDAITVPDLKKYAAAAGIDATKFATCLDGGEMASKVAADIAAGSAAGVSGTPSFFVNGKIIVGAQPYSAFQTAIDAELQ